MSRNELLQANDLLAILNNSDLVILATSMKDPFSGKDEATPNALIPGTRFFDFENTFSDLTSGLPHTLPDPAIFQAEIRKLGIGRQSRVVVYDFKGIYSAPRVWWMFKVMGHENVQVLDGGFPKWAQAKFPVVAEFEVADYSGDFESNFQSEWYIDKQGVLENLNKQKYIVLDARARNRFLGQAEEPRKGLRRGHIPQAKSLPFSKLVEDGVALNKESLAAKFKDVSADKEQPLIFSCGSGVTACILALLAREIGYQNLSVYDGSWSEWGGDTLLPIATSAK